jgi:MOSC domain-containing protein YiiM
MGEIVGIWRAPKRRRPMERLQTARVLENGLEGCAHSRPGKRSILFVAAQDLDELSVAHGAVKENFTVAGADVMSWLVGQRVAVGTAEFEISMVCDPCELMENIRPGLQAELEGKRGMLARVLKTGEVSMGDDVRLI